ncbi:hypothetical protein NPIL_272161 [Nephila pilipes]|uniref:Uncharacterized protein n=1 Tax=Nephila pilipes TaxID=299642 RepID=A0A8X6P763_NEPPI|nr:hypothetical protein NPIL_272161 [Nephila pilipes]
MPGRPMRNDTSSAPRLQDPPSDLYEYEDYEEEDDYEYKDCCCITGLIRDLDLIQPLFRFLMHKKWMSLSFKNSALLPDDREKRAIQREKWFERKPFKIAFRLIPFEIPPLPEKAPVQKNHRKGRDCYRSCHQWTNASF